MAKKLFHRIVIVWCLYGLVRFCIFINPLVFRAAKFIKPQLEDNNSWSSIPNVEWNHESIGQIMLVWVFVLVGTFVVLLIIAAIHNFSNWFFNEKPKEDE